MCGAAVREDPWYLKFVPDHFKTQEMFKKTVEVDPSSLELVLDHLKTQEMYDKAVRNKPCIMLFVPDHFKPGDVQRDNAYHAGSIFPYS